MPSSRSLFFRGYSVLAVLMASTVLTFESINAEDQVLPPLPRIECVDLLKTRPEVLSIYSEWIQDSSLQEVVHVLPPHPLTIIIPPADLQFGGRSVFQGLYSVAQNIQRGGGDVSDFGNPEILKKIFVNQQLNLDLLAPGTAIAFAGDMEGNTAFGFSHGRFSYRSDSGTLNDLDYNDDQGEGKYPWPRDSNLHFFPGSMLFEANGVHSQLANGLRAALSNEGRSQSAAMYGGALTVGVDGRIQLVYISGQLNDQDTSHEGDAWLARTNFRAMSLLQRPTFHQVLARTFLGRNMLEVATNAPVDIDTVRDEGNVAVYPNTVAIPDSAIRMRTLRDIVHGYLTSEGFDEILSRADYEFWTPIVYEYFDQVTPEETDTAEHRYMVRYFMNRIDRFIDRVAYYNTEDEITNFIIKLLGEPWYWRAVDTEDHTLFRLAHKLIEYRNRRFPYYMQLMAEHVFGKREVSQEIGEIERASFLRLFWLQRDNYSEAEMNQVKEAFETHYLSKPWFDEVGSNFERSVIESF